MKNKGRCPKCGGSDIIYAPGGKLESQTSVTLPGGLFAKTIRIATYICRGCGFAEQWVDRDSDMDALRSYRKA